MIFGISGKMGSGKTTTAQIIQHMLAQAHVCGEGVPVLRAFGDALKVEVARLYEFPLAWAYSEEGKARTVKGQTVRKIMIDHGAMRRAEDPYYWLKALDRDAELDISQGNHVIVHDVRFPNEAQWILGREGTLIRVETYPNWEPGPHAGDKSETALDDFQGWHEVLRPEFGMLTGEVRRLMVRLAVRSK